MPDPLGDKNEWSLLGIVSEEDAACEDRYILIGMLILLLMIMFRWHSCVFKWGLKLLMAGMTSRRSSIDLVILSYAWRTILKGTAPS